MDVMQASKARDGTICTLLLGKGASPRAKDSTGSVPLHRFDSLLALTPLTLDLLLYSFVPHKVSR